MARIRTIKPEFWTDETLAECSPIARLLFVAALNFADDNGNLERSSRQLKAQAFPYDGIDCEPLVLEMIRTGLLIEYQVAERKYLHIKGFLTHQKIDKPSKCRIPLYEESMRSRLALVEPSPSPRSVRESKGRESNGGEGNTTARKSAPTEPLEFLDFKIAYPTRAGDQGWRKAQRAAHARILEGYSWIEMLEGAKRYAAYVRSTGNEGTQYVKQAATFLGPELLFREPWDPPKSKAENQRDSNIENSQEWLHAS